MLSSLLMSREAVSTAHPIRLDVILFQKVIRLVRYDLDFLVTCFFYLLIFLG